MADKTIINWETNIGISDLYNLDLDQLAHIDVIGRMAKNIRLRRMFPEKNWADKWAANLHRFTDWLNEDPGPGILSIIILVIATFTIGFFTGAYR